MSGLLVCPSPTYRTVRVFFGEGRPFPEGRFPATGRPTQNVNPWHILLSNPISPPHRLYKLFADQQAKASSLDVGVLPRQPAERPEELISPLRRVIPDVGDADPEHFVGGLLAINDHRPAGAIVFDGVR